MLNTSPFSPFIFSRIQSPRLPLHQSTSPTNLVRARSAFEYLKSRWNRHIAEFKLKYYNIRHGKLNFDNQRIAKGSFFFIATYFISIPAAAKYSMSRSIWDDQKNYVLRCKIKIPIREMWVKNSVTSKKSPNVYESCPKMIPLETWKILTCLQKLPTNLGDFAK